MELDLIDADVDNNFWSRYEFLEQIRLKTGKKIIGKGLEHTPSAGKNIFNEFCRA